MPQVSSLRVARCRTPYWNKIEPAGEAALEAASERLARAGATVKDLVLPASFEAILEAQHTIMVWGGRATFLDIALEFSERLYQDFHDQVNNKFGITPETLVAA